MVTLSGHPVNSGLCFFARQRSLRHADKTGVELLEKFSRFSGLMAQRVPLIVADEARDADEAIRLVIEKYDIAPELHGRIAARPIVVR